MSDDTSSLGRGWRSKASKSVERRITELRQFEPTASSPIIHIHERRSAGQSPLSLDVKLGSRLHGDCAVSDSCMD